MMIHTNLHLENPLFMHGTQLNDGRVHYLLIIATNQICKLYTPSYKLSWVLLLPDNRKFEAN